MKIIYEEILPADYNPQIKGTAYKVFKIKNGKLWNTWHKTYYLILEFSIIKIASGCPLAISYLKS